MAVRTARNTGLIITLIFFVFLSLVGLGLSFMFYSRQTEAQARAATAQTEMERYIESGRRNAPEIQELLAQSQAGDTKRTVVEHLRATVDRLKRAFAGSEQLSVEQIEAQMKEAGVAEGRSAMDFIQDLKNERDAAQKQVAELQEQIEGFQKDLEALAALRERVDTTAKQQQEALAADLDKITKDVAALEQAQQERLTGLEASITKKQADADQKIQEAANEKRDLEASLKGLQERLANLQGSQDRDLPQAPETTNEVDGQIIAIPPNKSIVYINLGRQDHLVLGTTFEVFGPERGVEVQADENDRVLKRGKATVEVVSMSDKSAACRVVRSTFGQPIVVGDVIANLIYDKQRTFKFYVFGDFNLDGVGEPSLSDREMVINLIERWGGRVVEAEERERRVAALGETEGEQNLLPFDTDFLIIGQEPAVPDAPSDDADAAQIKRITIAREQLAQFNRLKAEAESLGIPILNQNRFLALIGYYQR